MKKFNLTLPLVFISLFFIQACSNTDSVGTAKTKNEMRNNVVSDDTEEFLVEMADARMMDTAESEEVLARGKNPAVLSYARKMVEDQKTLIMEIRSLAEQHHVTLPSSISAEKKDGLSDLKKLKGPKLDELYLTMIERDHERDVREFMQINPRADYPGDTAIAAFAKKRLPMIQAHLMEVRKVSEAR